MLHCKAIWLALLASALLVATSKAPDPPKSKEQPKKPAQTSPAGDAVAATVNGERIMLSELVGRLNELGVAQDRREELAGNVLDGMIENVLLTQFLTAQSIPYDSKTVDSQIAEVKREYEKEGVKFQEALAQIGLTEQKLRAAVIAQVQWQNYLNRQVTDKQLAEYFTKYREYFDGTELRASHILVEIPTSADARTRAAAKAKIQKIRTELTSGSSFADAAKKYSDCPSKDQGGDVGWFNRRDKMVEPFARAAFALKGNEISDPVETEFGLHVIRVTGRKPGTHHSHNDAEVRAPLLLALGEELKNEITAKQFKSAKIEIAPGIPSPQSKTASQPGGNVKK